MQRAQRLAALRRRRRCACETRGRRRDRSCLPSFRARRRAPRKPRRAARIGWRRRSRSRRLATSSVCRACARRCGSSTTPTSPPCSPTISRNFSRACPEAIKSAESFFPSSTVFTRSPRKNIHAASSRHSSRKSAGPRPGQHFDRLGDFHGIAGLAPERLVHVGQQRDDFLAHALAGFDQQFGQVRRVLDLLHERAGAGLHVEHQRVDPLGQFLAHDGSADQRGAFHRPGHVAQRIDFLVGGSDFGRLPDQGAPAGFQDAPKFGERQIDVEIREWIPACRACRRYAPGRAR